MAERQLDLLDALVQDSEFLVRQSPRARHMAINIGVHGVVEVVVPRRTRPETVARFVDTHRAWIDRTLADIHAANPGIERDMPDLVSLPAIERQWPVRYGAMRCRETTECIELTAQRNDRPVCRTQLRRWLQRKARAHLVPLLQQKSSEIGMPYRRAQVRGQRTRWGSCSSSGTISLNFCLLFLEPGLVEYLLVHELCHTQVMNHSRRYWRLVEQHCRDYRVLERRLDAAWREVPAWVSGVRA